MTEVDESGNEDQIFDDLNSDLEDENDLCGVEPSEQVPFNVSHNVAPQSSYVTNLFNVLDIGEDLRFKGTALQHVAEANANPISPIEQMASTEFVSAENVLIRARAGFLKEGEALHVKYLHDLEYDNAKMVFHNPTDAKVLFHPFNWLTLKNEYHTFCLICDDNSTYGCILSLTGNRSLRAPVPDSIIECLEYEFLNDDLKIDAYAVYPSKLVRSTLLRYISIQSFESAESFLKQGTIYRMLNNCVPYDKGNITIYLYLRTSTLDTQNPRYANCMFYDADYHYPNFLVKHEALTYTNDVQYPCMYRKCLPGVFLITSYRLAENGEIYLECRRVSVGKMDDRKPEISWDHSGKYSMNWMIYRYDKEIALKNLLEKAEIELKKKPSWTVQLSGRNEELFSCNITNCTCCQDPGEKYFYIKIQEASTSNLVSLYTEDLNDHQRHVAQLSLCLRKIAYKKMVAGQPKSY